MGVPKKSERSFLSSLWEGERKLPRIRDIPPKKLLKTTAFFFFSSLGIFIFFGGPLSLFHQDRVLQDARRAAEVGYLQSRDGDRIGSSKPYSRDYGFDYHVKDRSAGSCESEAQRSD
jgi:hypothetical protein